MTPGFLIVDGASSMRSVIRDVLEKEEYHNISEAENGDEACELFDAESPDVIIMDLSIDGRSGMECLKEMKEKNNAVKIIICSASAHRELVMEAVKLGASDFILKPLKPQRLLQAVTKALNSF
ncbi:response regulator [Ruminococcus sp. HUN007]|uniref:response regulator n=1 Tax=Ruminococcus sp. HUN007 TaxID=1514668 RepID=UPI0005D25FC2|nr:response regulator [Ruminococcus sp. HUN007]